MKIVKKAKETSDIVRTSALGITSSLRLLYCRKKIPVVMIHRHVFKQNNHK